VTSRQEDPRELLRRALATEDTEERHAIVVGLQGRTDRATFDAACALTRSPGPRERELGLDVLGQIGYLAGRPFLEDTLPAVLACCADDWPEVLSSAVVALGHLADPRGLSAVLGHVAHPSDEVRFAVTFALPSVAGDPPAGEAISALIRLTCDPDPEIRDWAVMGIGSSCEADTPQVRDALAERLTDQEGDIAGEALLGLAQRKDLRALARLLAALDAEHPGNLDVMAAAALGAPEALPALRRLAESGWTDWGRRTTLDQAIRACSR
jgi:HEAT repeat protein